MRRVPETLVPGSLAHDLLRLPFVRQFPAGAYMPEGVSLAAALKAAASNASVARTTRGTSRCASPGHVWHAFF